MANLQCVIKKARTSQFSKIAPSKKLSKTHIGRLIALVLRFEYREDDHIGIINGVIHISFYEPIFEKLPDPDATSSGRPSSLKIAEIWFGENSLERNENEEYERFLNPTQLVKLFTGNDEDSISVPSYQRSSQQWKAANRELMVDSMLCNIPMPSIVLGKTKERPKDPWQLVDGHQRLSCLKAFMDPYHIEHFQFLGSYYEEMDEWAREKFDTYEFNIERVIAKDLSRACVPLYSRYNSSGKSMTAVQSRVARWHEISGLHHLLLAMAGGPTVYEPKSPEDEDNRKEQVRVRMGIDDIIDQVSNRATALRQMLPSVAPPSDDEKFTLRLRTEKV